MKVCTASKWTVCLLKLIILIKICENQLHSLSIILTEVFQLLKVTKDESITLNSLVNTTNVCQPSLGDSIAKHNVQHHSIMQTWRRNERNSYKQQIIFESINKNLTDSVFSITKCWESLLMNYSLTITNQINKPL